MAMIPAGARTEDLKCKPLAFALTDECIRERHLGNKLEAFARAIAEAQTRFGVHYDIHLQVINSPAIGVW
jgi:hypothetical protein